MSQSNYKINSKIYIPHHLQIEIVNGLCTVKCVFCNIESWSRKPDIMNDMLFEKIIKKFIPYKNHINYVSIVGCGETLLDKNINNKIKMLKNNGFKDIGLITNCTELNYDTSNKILKSELDTLICSVDGFYAKTHESIRKGSNFNKIISNILSFIKIRNENDYKTKVILRFVKNDINKDEWNPYFNYWKDKLNSHYDDKIILHNVYNPSNMLSGINLKKLGYINHDEYGICSYIFNRIWIYSNGDVALCCNDYNNSFHLGNVLYDNPIDIFNNKIFTYHRNMILQNKYEKLNLCKECTTYQSELTKKIYKII